MLNWVRLKDGLGLVLHADPRAYHVLVIQKKVFICGLWFFAFIKETLHEPFAVFTRLKRLVRKAGTVGHGRLIATRGRLLDRNNIRFCMQLRHTEFLAET